MSTEENVIEIANKKDGTANVSDGISMVAVVTETVSVATADNGKEKVQVGKTTTITALPKTSTSALGDLLLQHSEIGDWCDVVDKQIDEVGYEVTETKKFSIPSVPKPVAPPVTFAPPFCAHIGSVHYRASRSDIFYFFGGHEKVSFFFSENWSFVCQANGKQSFKWMVLQVHMYMYDGQFNGNCMIELKNFVAFIEALKKDEAEFMGRRLNVEYYNPGRRRYSKYSYQDLENAREDSRHGPPLQRQTYRTSMDGQRGRQQYNRHSVHSDYGSSYQSTNSSQPMHFGEGMVSNDVRNTQQAYGGHSSQYQRGSNNRPNSYSKGGPSVQPRLRVEEKSPPVVQPVVEQKPTPKPAYKDIFGHGKPADTSNKLWEIQKKLDEEQHLMQKKIRSSAFHQNEHRSYDGDRTIDSLQNSIRLMNMNVDHQELRPLSDQRPVFTNASQMPLMPLLSDARSGGGASQPRISILQREKHLENQTISPSSANHSTEGASSGGGGGGGGGGGSTTQYCRQFTNQARRNAPTSGAGGKKKRNTPDVAGRGHPRVCKSGIDQIKKIVDSVVSNETVRVAEKSTSDTVVDNTGAVAENTAAVAVANAPSIPDEGVTTTTVENSEKPMGTIENSKKPTTAKNSKKKKPKRPDSVSQFSSKNKFEALKYADA